MAYSIGTSGSGNYGIAISGLAAGTVYHYRVVASNIVNTTTGLDANFQTSGQTYSITTSASPTTGGTTSGDGNYASGQSVTVTATPNTASGYAFVNWTENGTQVSTAASYTFTAAANRTLTANFSYAGPAPVARFSGDQQPVTGKTATYNGGISSGTGLSYAWTVSDGRTANGSVAQFAFNSPGTYTVYLTVNDSIGRYSVASATIYVQYDALDRLTNYVDAAGNVIKYTYDNVGNLTSLTYPDGKIVYYSYGVNNWLNYVQDWGGYRTYYYYDADGRVIEITHPDGTTTTRAYDAAGRLVQQADVNSSSSNIYSVNFAYDAASQIVGETNLPVAATNYQPATVTNKYDADNALIAYNGQTVTTDANGNMTSGPLTNGTFTTYTYDVRNRLTSAGGITYPIHAMPGHRGAASR